MPWKKALLAFVAAFALVTGGWLGYLYLSKPAMAEPWKEKFDPTPQRLARGKFLFHNVTHCGDCHSKHDDTRFGRPVWPEAEGIGTPFPAGEDFPGTLTSSNLTPDPETGLGNWTDGEKARAIREGVSRDGRALFPVMPYQDYRWLSDEDVRSLVVYLNTLTPVRNPLPPTKINFPVNLFIKALPQPVGRVPQPDPANRLKYGEYLAHISGCESCHTPMVKGEHDYTRRFGGGREFPGPHRSRVVSANISSDPETGIGRWSAGQFVEKFYQYRKYLEEGSPPVGPEGFTVMPWLGICQWPQEDLEAVYSYLMSQPGVKQAVETHPGS